MLFADRADAGRGLARRLEFLRGADPVVLGLPRGGVPVGYEVARALDAPLDVIVVRKLGVPSQPELAMGAIGEGGVRVLNETVLESLHLAQPQITAVEDRERAELARRTAMYRQGRAPVQIAGRVVVVVDDGIATGSTARAACQIARAHGASLVILAVPVGPPESVEALRDASDQVICLHAPAMLCAVGQYYEDFRPVSDGTVAAMLEAAAPVSPPPPCPDAPSAGPGQPASGDPDPPISAGPDPPAPGDPDPPASGDPDPPASADSGPPPGTDG
jgi:putative phosphoribosyl transferase